MVHPPDITRTRLPGCIDVCAASERVVMLKSREFPLQLVAGFVGRATLNNVPSSVWKRRRRPFFPLVEPMRTREVPGRCDCDCLPAPTQSQPGSAAAPAYNSHARYVSSIVGNDGGRSTTDSVCRIPFGFTGIQPIVEARSRAPSMTFRPLRPTSLRSRLLMHR